MFDFGMIIFMRYLALEALKEHGEKEDYKCLLSIEEELLKKYGTEA
jgi:hypothetical protein